MGFNVKSLYNDNKNQINTQSKSPGFNVQSVHNKEFELKDNNNKSIGTVSYAAKKAIERNALDSYTPKNENERKVLEEYKKYSSDKYNLFSKTGMSTFNTTSAYKEREQELKEERKRKDDELNSMYGKYGIDPDNFSYTDFESWAKEHNFDYQIVGNTPQNHRRVLAPLKDENGKVIATDEEMSDRNVLEQLAKNNERKKTSNKDNGAVGAFALKVGDGATFGAYSGLSDKKTKKEYEAAGLNPDEFVSDSAAYQKTFDKHKIASFTGELAGSTAALGALGKLVGGAAKGVKWIAKAPGWVQSAINSGITFAVQSGAETAFDGGNFEDVLKSAGINLVGGAVGGGASYGVGKIGEKLVFNKKLQESVISKMLYGEGKTLLQHKVLPSVIEGGAKSAAFAGAKTASTYFLYPEESRPTKEQMAMDISTAFAFGAISSGINTIKTSSQNKKYLDGLYQKMASDYENMAKANISGKDDTAGIQKFAKNVVGYSNAMEAYLTGKEYNATIDGETYTFTPNKIRLVGQDKYVNSILSEIDTIRNNANSVLNGFKTQSSGDTTASIKANNTGISVGTTGQAASVAMPSTSNTTASSDSNIPTAVSVATAETVTPKNTSAINTATPQTSNVLSARIEKAAVGSQVPNADNSPQPTSETPLVSSSASNDIVSQGNDTVNGQTAIPYSDKEKQNWGNSKDIIVYESDEQFEAFAEKVLKNVDTHKKIYFGKIPDETAQRVLDKTGIDVSGHNIALKGYEIRKILLNSHGDEKAEATRGQEPITIDDLKNIPSVITSPDTISLSEKEYEGKPAILFEKTIDGKNYVVAYVSKKHHDIAIQTMYKKRSLATAENANALSSTSETTSSTASNNIVSQGNDTVNLEEAKRNNVLSTVRSTLKSEITEDKRLMNMLAKKFGNDGLEGLARELEAYYNKNKSLDMFEALFTDNGQEICRVLNNNRDIKYSISSDDGDITQNDIEAIQAIGQKSINDFTSEDIQATEAFAKKYYSEMGEKSPFFRAWFGDWRADDKTPVKIANEKGNARGIVKNNDTGWDIQISGKVFSESKHAGTKNQTALPYLDYINSIAENSVLLDTYTISNKKAKSENSALMHSLYSIADMGEGKSLVKLYVEELNDVNSDGTIKRAYQLQNITSQQLKSSEFRETLSSIIPTADTYSVSQLFEIVKEYDKNFNPKPSSKVINEDGTPKVVYHGTSENFTVFDANNYNKNETSGDYVGEGFYFAKSKTAAKRYGTSVIAAYLDIKNPLVIDTETDAKSFRNTFLGKYAEGNAELRELIGGDYDYFSIMDKNPREIREELQNRGYDGLIDNLYGQYAVFSPEQIKSATDNIGTFDKQNSDIRYKLQEKTEIFEAKSEDIEKFSGQIDKWQSGEMQPNEQFHLGQTPNVLKALGAKDLPVVMTQKVMAKITGGKHDISIDELKKLPSSVAEPIMVFKSATTPNAFVMLTEMTDTAGDSIIAALHLNRKVNRFTVNNIASVYGKVNINNFVEKQAQIGNLLYIDKIKSQQWATSRGLQLPKLVQSIADNNSILQKEDIVNNYNTENIKKYSSEREDFTNEQSRSNLLSGNSGRAIDESTGKQAWRVSSYKRTLEGKTRAERKSTAKELTQRGYTEEVVNGNHKYTLIKEDGYTEDMRSIVSEAKAYGKEVGFFIGNAIRKFDGQRNFKIDGIKLTENKILIRYDGTYSPQALLMHEIVHTEWDNPEMQKAKDIILSDLSESDKKEILQNGRYKDYTELYNGDEDAVWEEFIADIFADMNGFAENYIDTAVDYWYNDKVTDRYNPSEYTRSIDAGGNEAVLDNIGFGNEYSLNNYTPKIELTRQEYVLVSRAVMAKNAGKTDSELKPVDFVYAADEFYVYENHSIGEFSVIRKYDVETEYDKIDDVKECVNNGTYTDRKRLDRLIDDFRRGKGSYSRNNGRSENGRYAMADDRISGEQQRSNSIGYSSGIGTDNTTSKINFEIAPTEKRQLDDYVLRKNHSSKLEKVDCKEIGNNFYVWENNSKTDYTVVNMVEIDGNEDLINEYRKDVKNGDFRGAESVREWSANIRNRRRNGTLLNANVKRTATDGSNDRFSIGQSGSNEVGYSGKSGGNTQKYALTDSENEDFWNEWFAKAREYGVIPKGENPVRDVDVPKKISENKVVSRFARTILEAGVTPEWSISEFEKAILDGKMTHEVITNKKAQKKATERIEKNGFTEALNYWYGLNDFGKIDKYDLALGMELYNQCITNKDTHNAMKISAGLAAEATRAGQTLQACRLLKLMSPDGQLYYLEKSVRKMNDEFAQKIGKKYKGIELDEKQMSGFLNAENEEKRNEVYDEICLSIANQIPATLRDKWNAWRYLAMLGNPRTHIRNIVGNAVFIPSVRAKNYVGAVIERAAKISPENRTHSARKSKEAIAFAQEDFAKMKKVLQGENDKYAVTSDIYGKRTIFKTKWLETLRKKNFDLLEAEDMIFLKLHYIDALARLITVRKIDVNNIHPEKLEVLRAYAVKEAQAATYRDANALAEGLNRLQIKMDRSDKKSIRAVGVLTEGVMPFKKTPLNIAKQGVNYSPIGILKGLYETVQKYKDNDDVSADKIVDDFAKGITGTAATLLGFWLASLGILVGARDKSKKEKEFDKMTGEQSYAVNIVGNSYTIGWMTPSNLSLFIGANLYYLTKDDFKTADVIDAMSTVAEPLLELSVFSGVNDLIESTRYSGSEAMVAMVSDMATSYLMQALPTLGGQISRLVDGTKREYYYTDKNSSIPKGIQRLIGQASSKIPFASYLFEPSVDAWGREETYGNLFERAFENSVSPGYYAKENYTDVDRELKELFERTGESSVFPTTQQKYYVDGGVYYYMNAKDYIEAKKMRGQRSFELIENLISSSDYARMSDEEKIKAIEKCYEKAGKETKAKMLEKVKNKSK